jgi:uncharacterized protein YegJ (DUF2314 family)
MRTPDFELDGWCLEDGEARARASPKTFQIPPRWVRHALEPGDFAQLIFRIAVDDEDGPEEFERMWVIVRERTPGGYMGVLNNQPGSIGENDLFWFGTELPFEPKHVIDVSEGNAESLGLAQTPAPIPWLRN